MSGARRPDRSTERCPACGGYQLALIGFPDLDSSRQPVQHAGIGMVEPHVDTPPSIGCLSCGEHWDDLEAFRAAQRAGGSAS